MKTITLLSAIMLCSCQNFSLVSNKGPDGQFITPVSPKNGSPATASATIYKFAGGDYGATLWTDGSTLPFMMKLP